MKNTTVFLLCLVVFLALCLDGTDAKRERNVQKRNNNNRPANKRIAKRKNGNGKRRGQGKRGKKGTRRQKKRTNGCARQSTTFCPAEKAMALNLMYNKVANFFKQVNRAKNFAKIMEKKKGKKDDFANDAAILEDAVGGNLSAPACTRAGRSSDAKDQGELLKNCSNSIEESCADVTINTTVTGDCDTKMKAFETKVTECKTSDDCTCWTAALAMKSDLTPCNALDELNRVKALKDSCVSNFGDCKKAQDSAVELTATCPASQPSNMMTTMAAKRRRLVADILAKSLIHYNSN